MWNKNACCPETLDAQHTSRCISIDPGRAHVGCPSGPAPVSVSGSLAITATSAHANLYTRIRSCARVCARVRAHVAIQHSIERSIERSMINGTSQKLGRAGADDGTCEMARCREFCPYYECNLQRATCNMQHMQPQWNIQRAKQRATRTQGDHMQLPQV